MNLNQLKRRDLFTALAIALILIVAIIMTISVLNIKVFAGANNTNNTNSNTIDPTTCDHNFSRTFTNYASNNKHGRVCSKCGAAANPHDFRKSTAKSTRCAYTVTINGEELKCNVVCHECNGEGKSGGCGTCGSEIYEACDHEFSNTFTNYSSTNMHGRVCTKCGITAANPHQFKKGTTINGRCAYSITIGTTTYKCNVVCHECNGAGKSGGCATCGLTATSTGDECTHNRSTQWHYPTRTLTSHSGSCNICQKSVTNQAHVDYNSNGICDYCGVCMTGKHQWTDSTSGNTRYCAQNLCGLVCSHNGLTTGTCSTCGKVLSSSGNTHTHVYTSKWEKKDDGKHYLYCDVANCTSTKESHSAQWESYVLNPISNRHERYCGVTGCTMRDWDTEHAPADTNNDGLCDVCGFNMGTSGGDTHTHSYTNKWEKKDDGKHYLFCDVANCTSTKESHRAQWENYVLNPISNRHERYCGVTGCTMRDWDTEHAPADTNNDGLCDVCGFNMGTSGGDTHTHSYTSNWVIGADGNHYLKCDSADCLQYKESHYPLWDGTSCTANRLCLYCGITDGQTLGHDWKAATCTDPETCRRCQTTQGTALGHNWQAATCTEPAKCSRCQTTQGTALGHDWKAATCTDPEKCSRCQTMQGTALGHNWQAATCTKPKTCSRCQLTDGQALGHNWQAATCTKPKTCTECNITEGTALGHDFANWTDNNDGTHKGTCNRCQIEQFEGHTYDGTNKCTKCNAVKQNTTCEHEWKIDKTGATETQHWEKCTKCQEKRNIANHTFVNGKCNVCDYVCKHTHTTVKKDETNHWKECNNCGEQLDKKAHNYENGKCECGKEEGSTTCEHDWKIDKTGATETQHWEKCTKCQEKRNVAYHTFKNGICNVCGYTCKHTTTTVKSDETNHWKECNNCGEQLDKKAHSYENGKCECGKTKESGEEECIHTNREWKTNETEHWQVCKDCGKEIKGTRGNHVNVNGKCKNCGATEKTTTSGKNLPNTGNIAKITSAVLIITVICGISYIGFRKYKDIK